MDWFLYDRDLRHERVNALLLVCIHRDTFFDYDKIIDIYEVKYPRKMLLINPLVKTKLLKRFTLEKQIKLMHTLAFLLYILPLLCFT